MAHKPLDSGQPAGKGSRGGSAGKKRKLVLPEFLQAHLQSRQLISSMRLRPADACGAQPGRAAPAGCGAAPAAGHAVAALASAPTACLVGGGRTVVPYRTLPLIFKQRRQHLQQQKSRARHTEPYQQRPGEGLLSLPEDVLVRWLAPAPACSQLQLPDRRCVRSAVARQQACRPPAGWSALLPLPYVPTTADWPDPDSTGPTPTQLPHPRRLHLPARSSRWCAPSPTTSSSRCSKSAKRCAPR